MFKVNLLWVIFFKKDDFDRRFAHMFIRAACACLVFTKVRRRCQIYGNRRFGPVVSHPVGIKNQTRSSEPTLQTRKVSLLLVK